MDDCGSATPLDVDLAFYRALYPDLATLSDAEAAAHYQRFGEREGRAASPASFHDLLLASIGAEEDVLEIGPNLNPFVTGRRAKYFEVLDAAGLEARAAAAAGFPGQRAPVIDYVSATGDLDIVPDSAFDVALSRHCIEHMPDLVAHLNKVARILRPRGRYIVMVPDKRYCLDHFIPLTTVAEVIEAHHEGRITHGIGCFVKDFALTTHNDTVRHWAGDHGVQKVFEDPNVLATAVTAFRAANGCYVDHHAWRFTARSFRDLLMQLLALGLTRLAPVHVTGTVRNSNTFVAILIQCAG